jgi:ketosteroid isomerase-like protein
MVARDWVGVAACLAPDVERLGPYGDDYHGVAEYVPFLQRTLESLDGYVMRVDRVSEVGTGVVVAELSETVTIDGARLETPEALVFDLAPDGRIARVAIFLRRSFNPD